MEKMIINLIKSLDRIMDTWDKLTLRRTLLISFSILLGIQTIITTIIWLINKDISNTWLGVLALEYGAFGTMISWYFSGRKNHNERRE